MTPFLNGKASPQRYLIETGARRFIVNFRTLVLIEALQQTSDPSQAAAYIQTRTNEVLSEEEIHAFVARLPLALFDRQIASKYKTSISCRAVLLSASTVERIAARTTCLFSFPFFLAFAIILAAVMPFIVTAARNSLQHPEIGWVTFAVCAFGFIFSAILHELGHASAVTRNGLAPGHIGFGLYWCFPAFYTDVNATWKLPPHKRVIVDLGGIYFQLIFLIAVLPFAFVGPAIGAVRLLVVFSLYSVLQNLNPVFKMDGYWILADLAQIPNLHARTRSFWSRLFARDPGEVRSRLVFTLYSLMVCLYSGYIIALILGFFRGPLLLRLHGASEYLGLCIGSCQRAEWSAAFAQLGEFFRVSAFPALTFLVFILWLVGVWRRSTSRIVKNETAANL